MGIYDIAMLVLLGGAILFGYWKGLAWQIASLAALIVSYIVAVTFREQVAALIRTEEPWNSIGAMLILFLGTSLLIWTIYGAVSRSLKKHELKGFDRQAGAVLGAIKGALLCMVVTMFAVSYLGEDAHEAVDHSRFGPIVEKGIWQVSAFVPDELARFVDPHIESYKAAVGNTEPEFDLNETLGSSYPAKDQSLNGQSSGGHQPGYQGLWDTFNKTVSGEGQSSGTQAQQSSWNQPQNGSGGYTGGLLPQSQTSNQSNGFDWSNTNISDRSKQLLEDVQEQGIQEGFEAAEEATRKWLQQQQQR